MISIIYDDEDLFVLDKPTGTPSAPLRSEEKATAVDFAVSRFPQIVNIGRHLNGKLKTLEPALLHRLDTGTSGLIVFAKTQIEFDRLIEVWKNREIQKYYRALVCPTAPLPNLSEGPLRLDFPIAHDARSVKKMIALTSQNTFRKNQIRGKPYSAITDILSLQSFRGLLADFEIKIETGVMHQIRCQLATKGWPIIGDKIYKGPPSDRLWLHAWRLKIPLKSGALLELEAPLPLNWSSKSSGTGTPGTEI